MIHLNILMHPFMRINIFNSVFGVFLYKMGNDRKMKGGVSELHCSSFSKGLQRDMR